MFYIIPTLLLFKTSLSLCGKVAQLTSEAPLIVVSLVSPQYHRGTNHSENYMTRNQPHHQTEMAKEFCLEDYDAIGFDLDNTLAMYNLKNLMELEYNCLAEYLVEHKNYNKEALLKPFNEESTAFLQRGLIVDSKRGNLLKLDSTGRIMKVAHGLSFLTTEEIKKTYGDQLTWDVTNEFVKDYLSTWNGPLSEQMRSFLDYFDMPGSLIFARAVEYIDKQNNGRPLDSYNVFKDMVDGFFYMYSSEHFAENKGKFFPAIKQYPDKYYTKCSPHILEWLKALKNKNKILFLLTGSYVDYASHTAKTCLGEDWKQYFDFIGYFSKKPGFFTGVNRPFLRISNSKEKDEILHSELEPGQSFSQGNWDGLMEAIKKSLNKTNIKTLYLGDNFIQDLYTPSKYSHWDTVAVCAEQAAEGFHTKLDPDSSHLKSNLWDSYFYITSNQKKYPTLWTDILKKHCKICVPSISYLASEPINKTYSTFDHEDLGLNTDGFHPK
ncbi:hypothetical protein WDU94_003865 [Cyamophila willieti]